MIPVCCEASARPSLKLNSGILSFLSSILLRTSRLKSLVRFRRYGNTSRSFRCSFFPNPCPILIASKNWSTCNDSALKFLSTYSGCASCVGSNAVSCSMVLVRGHILFPGHLLVISEACNAKNIPSGLFFVFTDLSINGTA